MSILYPDSKAPRTEQYKKAWADLASSNQFERAHAKCWLTYRACDGEITLDDWIGHISWQKVDNPGLRWSVSLATAEFFLWTLNAGECDERQNAEEVVLSAVYDPWPDGIAHFCRVMSILALEVYVKGGSKGSNQIIETAVQNWQNLMGSFDFKKFPNRFLECRYDLHAINFMLWLGSHLGLLKISDALERWIPASLKTQRNTPWWRCIEKTMEGRSGMWLPRLTAPVETDPRIRTRNDMAYDLFRGNGTELGVAKGDYTTTLAINTYAGTSFIAVDRWSDHHDLTEYLEVVGKFHRHPSVKILRCTFEEAAKLTPDASLGWVYIDGYAHTGQENGATLEQWWPKIKAGGIMAGHDYSPKYQPTMDAVDAFVAKHGLKLYVTTKDELPSWWVVKPADP